MKMGRCGKSTSRFLTRLLTNAPFQMEEEEAQGVVMAIRGLA